MSGRLLSSPEGIYLLRELDSSYRYGSAGGSKAIRRHRRLVRERLSDAFEDNVPVLEREPATLPVVAHLPRALELGTRGALAPFARTLDRVKHQLAWEYGYEKVPRHLAEKYAYCEVLGPQGPVHGENLILGLVLFAPRTTYPAHNHAGIEESYVSVAGAWSENDLAVYAPGSLILNGDSHEHRITTGDYEPTLLAYAWVGEPERLANPGMRFSGPRRPPR